MGSLSLTDYNSELKTDWINPFGISPKVKVLSPVSLGVEIVYAVSPSSGLAIRVVHLVIERRISEWSHFSRGIPGGKD